MTLELKKSVFDDEVAYFKKALHKTVLGALVRDGNLGSARPERMAALLFAMIDELAMAAAATNLIAGDNEGTDLVMAMAGVLPRGIHRRTLQLRHTVDEAEEVSGQEGQGVTEAGDRRQ